MNDNVALLLFKLNRNKPVKYAIALFTVFLTYTVFSRIFFGGSPNDATNVNSILENNSKDFNNAEVNTLLLTYDILKKVELDEFKLQAPYLDNEVSEQNYQFNGDVLINYDKYVRLTSEKKHQTSSFFSNKKVNAKSFVMEFYFSLNGKGDVASLHGDGMGIFFTSNKLPEGELFGVNEFYDGFAIYVDTYRNGRSGIFPYVLAARNDGTQKYDKDHDGKANEIDGCIARSLWNPVNGVTKGRLIYVQDGYVSLDFDYKNNGNWQNCFSLEEVYLPEEFHLGFSAQTGDLHENVDIVEVHMYSLYDHQDQPITQFKRLLEILNDPNSPDKFEQVSEEYKVGGDTTRRRLVSKKRPEKQTRRTLRRLQNSEKRLKREAEQRRQERRQKRREFFGKLKKYVYFAAFLVVVYLATVVYRVQRKNSLRKSKGHGIIA